MKVLHLNGTLDSEKALREKNRRIIELQHEIERLQGFTTVYVDPNVRQGYQQQERTTDPMQQKHQAHVAMIRTQHELPKLPQSMLHKHTLQRHSEPPPDATLSSIPTFLR